MSDATDDREGIGALIAALRGVAKVADEVEFDDRSETADDLDVLLVERLANDLERLSAAGPLVALDTRSGEVLGGLPDGTLQRRMFDNCVQAGWDPERRNTFAEECAHLHEELSEAFRAWRLWHDCEMRTDPETGKPEGVPAEFADVLIGLFYNAELHGFDLLTALEAKAAWNEKRDYVAEGRQLHPPRLVTQEGDTDAVAR